MSTTSIYMSHGFPPGVARILVLLIYVCLTGCDIDNRIEGCGSRADALVAVGLKPSDGVDFVLADKTPMSLPNGYMYRVGEGLLELFVAPGVYCDSGDWGLYEKGFARLQEYVGDAPEDPFQHFPETHRGYTREKIGLGFGPFDYVFEQNALTWQVRAYFGDVYQPHVIFMYLRTEVTVGGERRGLALHYFPDKSQRVLAALTAAIEAAVRESSRGAGHTRGTR